MELTGWALLLTVALVTTLATVALGLCWRRLRGRLIVLRAVGILVCESLLVAAVALALNRWGGFYPTWASLREDPATSAAPPARAAGLDASLLARAPGGGRDGYAFRWPAGLAGLAAPPVVWLAPAYFRRPGLAAPVVVVLAPAGAGAAAGAWDGDNVTAQGAPAQGCVVYLRLGPRTDVTALAPVLTARLAADLHVAGHDWGVVGVGPAAPAARRLAAADPGRFGPVLDVGTPAARRTMREALAAAFNQEPPALAPPVLLEPLPGPAAVGR